MGPSIILDDTSKDIAFYGTPDHWIVETDQDSLFNRSRTTCVAEVSERVISPSIRFSFTGKGMSLWGPSTTQLPFNYTIDGSSTRSITVDASAGASPSRTTGVRLWGLENIVPLGGSDTHFVEITPLSGRFAIDYILVNPSSRYWSGFSGKNLVLDDQDSMLKYTGSWSKSSGLGNPSWTSVPFNGTYTTTGARNATVSLFFEGSSISVYGLLNQQPGVLSASFSVDGGNFTKTYKPFDGSQTVNASSWRFNEQFFHQELSPGQHTLLIKVDEISGNQAFYLDSIVFQGTWETTLTTPILKPTLSTSPSTTSSSGHTFNKFIPIGIVIFLLLAGLTIARRIRNKYRANQARTENGLAGYRDDIQGPTYDPVPPYPYPVPATPVPVPLPSLGSEGSQQPPKREPDFIAAALYQASRSGTLNPPPTSVRAPSISRIRPSSPPPIYSTDPAAPMPAVSYLLSHPLPSNAPQTVSVQADQAPMVQHAPQPSITQTTQPMSASAVPHPAADNPRPADVQPQS